MRFEPLPKTEEMCNVSDIPQSARKIIWIRRDLKSGLITFYGPRNNILEFSFGRNYKMETT